MATRAWYAYFGQPGGEFNASNYIYVQNAPTCSTIDPNICSILGVYLPLTGHPATFGPRLNSYITNALAFDSAQPGPASGGRAFVYVKPA